MKTKLLTGYFILSFYVLGGLIIENDANYPTWYQLDASHFEAYHYSLESRLSYLLFTPLAIHLLLNGLLVWFPPAGIPRWPLVLTLLLSGYIIVESVLIQVPIHQALAANYSPKLVSQLIDHHRTWRLPAEVLVGSLNAWCLYRVIRMSTMLLNR
ncbi:hypothetical protein [Spirosoma arcticum]